MTAFRAWILIFILAATPAMAQTGTDPYSVSVWAMVLFGQDGTGKEIAVVDEARYPAKFLENVKARFARARIPPPEVGGQPATLRSGVELVFIVTPNDNGGTVRLDGVSIGPMPTKQPMARYPEDVKRSPGWQGEITGICKVSPEGRCASVEIAAASGMPESVRKFARQSLEHWEFEPQRLNGKPIEGEYRISFMLNTRDENAPADFRMDKFLKTFK
jgi:TonB family protein